MFLSALRQIPILRFLLSMIVGICLHEYFPDNIFGVAIAVIVAGIVTTVFFLRHPGRRYQHWPTLIMMVGFVLFGGAYARLHSTEMLEERGSCVATGYVSEILRDESGMQKFGFCADTLKFRGAYYTERKGLVSFYGEEKFVVGQRLVLDGYVKQPTSSEFGFDYYNYLKSNHFEFLAQAKSVEFVPDTVLTLECVLSKIRMAVTNRLSQSGISDDNVAFLQAIFLGDKSRLPRDTKEAFSSCGIVHLLAVSGLHVGIIFCIVGYVCQRLRLRPRAKCLVTLVVLWFYALICGLSPSIFRATIMMSFCAVGGCVSRRQNIYNTMAIALFVILLFDPMSLYSIGLWLSFCSVLGIVTFNNPLSQLFTFESSVMRRVYEMLLVSFIAQMSTLPISLYFFNTFPTYFLINNFIVIPFAMPVVVGAILVTVLGGIPYLGPLIATILDHLVSFMIGYAKMAAEWPHATITRIPFSTAEFVLLILVLVICASICFRPSAKLRRALVVTMFAFATLLFSTNFIAERRTNVSAFMVQGRIGVAITDGGESTVLLADTAYAQAVDAAYEIARQRKTPSPVIAPLERGTQIVVDDFVMSVSRKVEGVENQYILVTNGDAPGELDDATYIVSSNHTWRNQWALRAQEENAHIIWLENGRMVNLLSR